MHSSFTLVYGLSQTLLLRKKRESLGAITDEYRRELERREREWIRATRFHEELSDEELVKYMLVKHPEALVLMDVLRELGFFTGILVEYGIVVGESIYQQRAYRDVVVVGVGKLFREVEPGILEPVFIEVKYTVGNPWDPWIYFYGHGLREHPRWLFIIRAKRRFREDPEWLKKYLKYKLREIKKTYNLTGELTPADNGLNEYYKLMGLPYKKTYYVVEKRDDGVIEVYKLIPEE